MTVISAAFPDHGMRVIHRRACRPADMQCAPGFSDLSDTISKRSSRGIVVKGFLGESVARVAA